MDLGMSAKEFWSLCWYDLNLWIEKIIHDRKQRNEDREFTMEMTRQMMSLIHNISGKVANTDRPPSYFMKLSYDEELKPEKPRDEELQERLDRLKKLFPDGK